MPKPIHYGARAKLTLPTETSKASKTEATKGGDCHGEIRERVLGYIGRPDNLAKVDVKPLWDEAHFRINVYVERRGEHRLDASYFIHVVKDGIVASPPLDRRYYDDILCDLSA